jgi:hypothetical protein
MLGDSPGNANSGRKYQDQGGGHWKVLENLPSHAEETMRYLILVD